MVTSQSRNLYLVNSGSSDAVPMFQNRQTAGSNRQLNFLNLLDDVAYYESQVRPIEKYVK